MEKKYSWKRFWCPREGSFTLSERGFLADPDSKYGNVINPQAKTLLELDDIPCIILLGEPGIGKTNEIDEQYIVLKNSIGNNQFLHYELRDFQTDFTLSQDIFDSNPVFQNWLRGEDSLCLLLDSLDEGLLSLKNLSSILLKNLKKCPTERLKLRITCRTAEWSNFLEDGLRNLWGDDNVKAFELLPLRELDIVKAAECKEIDPEKFLNEIIIKEAVPLALKPVTLNFLLNIYCHSKRFPGAQTDLYLQGGRKLCEETNKVRSDLSLKGKLSTAKKFEIAARIAAIIMFSNRSAIWTEVGSDNTPESDVNLAELCGGTEFIDGDKFAVQEDEIWETLNTGLFSSRGPHRMGWAHQTYAEFLAAYYLHSHNVPISQQRNLLTHVDGNNKIVPQLYETAAWVASLNHQMFREITKSDPTVLLRSDISIVDEKDKFSLVNALLDVADRDEWLIDNQNTYRHFHKLKHSDLANQLKPYIYNTDKSFTARRVATDIAEACELQALQDALVDLVLNKKDDLELRENAAHAVTWIGDKNAKAKLKGFIFDDNEDDLNDNLKGYALQSLYPDQLSVKKMFSALTYPKRSNYFGAYTNFLYTDFSQYFDDSGVIEGLRWIREKNIASHFSSPFSETRKSIMKAAWLKLESADVLSELALTIVGSLAYENEDTKDFVINEKDRRTVLEALIPLLPQVKKRIFWLVHRRPHIVQQSDFNWLLERFLNEQSEDIKECLLDLLHRTFNIQNIEHTESLILASHKSSVIASAFAWGLGTIMLDSPQADALRRQHREFYGEDDGDNDEIKPLTSDTLQSERIKQYLEKFESGELAAWWRLNLEMMFEPDGTRSGSFNDSDLKDFPGWENADFETIQRIVNAARKYVQTADSEEDEWLGKDIIYHPAHAGYRALRLLSTEDPNFFELLSVNCWKIWAGIILTFPFQSSESDKEFQAKAVKIAYKIAPSKIVNAALLKIDQENAREGSLTFLSALNDCWYGDLPKAMLLKVQDQKLNPSCMGRILGELLSHDVLEAKNFAEKLINKPVVLKVDAEKRIESARELFLNADDAGWSIIWEKFQQDDSFGRRVIKSVGYHESRRKNSVFSRMTESQIAHLYIWMVNQYPYKDDPKHEGTFWVGEPDRERDFRDRILRHLENRGTNEAVAAVKHIMQTLPELDWLKWVFLGTQKEARKQTWKPYEPKAILEIAANNELRLVQSGEQLLNILIESLQRLELKLHGETPAVIDLWNEIDKYKFRPKDENRLSDYIKRHLEGDLSKRGVIVNREVEIRRGVGGFPGERTDIHVNAVLKNKNDNYEQITVIIETKGCWNKDLWDAMENQLKNRYLNNNQCAHGLYLVGKFDCPQWYEKDSRKKHSCRLTNEEMLSKLQDQAESLSQKDILIKPFILDVSLPSIV